MDAGLTDHARALPDGALDDLPDYGRRAYDHAGHPVVLHFDRCARRRLARAGAARRRPAAIARDRKPGRFLLTGSANLPLMKQVSESLAGRASYLTLWPMTRGE